MKPELFTYLPFTSEECNALTAHRDGEQRLGNTISLTPSTHTRFVILGIEESVGPQANKGFAGAENAFQAFLKRFLNMQSNRFLSGNEICLLGRIKQNSLKQLPQNLSEAVEQLDEIVSEVLLTHLREEHVLIVVGGGHNNAYPIIKSLHQIRNRSLNVLNLDPHADCRALEGRHSGNPFSYAMKDGHLNSYSVMGLHKAYNNETILDFLDKNKCKHSFYDDLISDKRSFQDELADFVNHLKGKHPIGVELDMDAIAHSPSSAFSPSGFSSEEARYYVSTCSKQLAPVYLHLPEAAPMNEQEEKISGKLLAYLTYDFIINHTNNSNQLKI